MNGQLRRTLAEALHALDAGSVIERFSSPRTQPHVRPRPCVRLTPTAAAGRRLGRMDLANKLAEPRLDAGEEDIHGSGNRHRLGQQRGDDAARPATGGCARARDPASGTGWPRWRGASNSSVGRAAGSYLNRGSSSLRWRANSRIPSTQEEDDQLLVRRPPGWQLPGRRQPGRLRPASPRPEGQAWEIDQEREGVFCRAQAAATGRRAGHPPYAVDCQSWADATFYLMGLAPSTQGERAGLLLGDPAVAGPSHYVTPSERVEVQGHPLSRRRGLRRR
jgi:hypothetical protein